MTTARSLRTGDVVTVFPGDGLVRIDSSETTPGLDA